MLNKDGVRELAYVVVIDAIEPIVGSDNCEAAVVGGWRVMTRKGTLYMAVSCRAGVVFRGHCSACNRFVCGRCWCLWRCFV